MKRNQLLSKPPRAEHRLQDTRSFRRLFGRPPKQADYDGVHTATDPVVAAAYAISAWRALGDGGYPVLVSIDVSGLDPQPDVDAMLRGAEAVQDLLPEYRKLAAEGQTFWDMLNEEDFQALELGIGDDPISFVFEDVGTKLLPAIDAYAASRELDAVEVFARVLKTGELPNEVLTRLVGQQRYLTDIDLDRIVKIEAIKPWAEAVVGDYDDEEFEAADARGYFVFTMMDWPFSDPGDTKTLWKAPDASTHENIEYHGTTSRVIELAFPGLIPEETPFPIEEE